MMEKLEAMELINSMTTKQVTKMFEESFECQNVLVMSTAIKVLAKRGDYDVIANVVTSYIKSGNSLQLNSGFAIALGQSLFDIRNSSPLLGYIGKSINRRSGKGEVSYDNASLQEDISETGNNFPILKAKISNLDLFTIRDGGETKEETVKSYLEQLSARDIALMKTDTYEAIIGVLIKIYMSDNDRISATEKALEFVRTTLKPQLEKLSENTELVGKMKERIHRELF